MKRNAIKAKCIHLSFYLIGNKRLPRSKRNSRLERCQRYFCTKFPDTRKLVIVPSGASFLKFKGINYRCRRKNTKKRNKNISRVTFSRS